MNSVKDFAKQLIWLSLFLLISRSTLAQYTQTKNSLRLAVEANYLAHNGSQGNNAFKYSLIRSQQIKLSRWDYEASIGYMSHYLREQYSPFDFYYNGTHTQRITGDLSFLFTISKAARHAFRVGAGPSIWYQRNGFITDISAIVNSQGIEKVTFNRVYLGEFNVGLNLKTDYEYSVTPEIIAGVRAGITANFLTPDARASLPGTLYSAGISIGYRF